jgi:hypothetical protein
MCETTILYNENGGNMFLRKAGNYLIEYMPPHLTWQENSLNLGTLREQTEITFTAITAFEQKLKTGL